jgi:hypothetical protein
MSRDQVIACLEVHAGQPIAVEERCRSAPRVMQWPFPLSAKTVRGLFNAVL